MTGHHNRSTKMANANKVEKAERDNVAWAMVVARETGKTYHTEWDIKLATRVGSTRIKSMVARCRAMRRALGIAYDLPADWWTARMVPLPDTTSTTPASRRGMHHAES